MLALVPVAFAALTRVPPPRCVAAGAYASDDWGRSEQANGAASQPPRAVNRWQRIGDCDVLLPEEGTPCTGLVHFVGGALVGAAPLQAYGPFLEAIGAGGGTSLGIVATPVQGLTGLDHWAAASEVLLRWCAAKRELDAALFVRGDPSTDTLPTVGLGHSLGAKLLVLLGSDAQMVDAMGPRAANVLVAYNNFAAATSIPLLQQAVQLGDAARGDRLADVLGVAAAQGAGSALGAAGELGAMLGQGAASALQGLTDSRAREPWASPRGTPSDSTGSADTTADAVRRALDATALQLGAFGREAADVGRRARRPASAGAAAAGGAGSAAGVGAGASTAGAPEFTPGPAATDALVLSSYKVGRNLLVRLIDDEIDQSTALARLLQTRFTDSATGIGGRLDFRRLEGTHVTPNVPSVAAYLDGFDWEVAARLGVADAAQSLHETACRAEDERLAVARCVADFVEREVARAAAVAASS